MVKHVVMWRFADKGDAARAREQIESMRGRVSSMLSLETGLNFLDSPASYDLVLITEHTDRAALDAYQADPVHADIKRIVGGMPAERTVVDFETSAE